MAGRAVRGAAAADRLATACRWVSALRRGERLRDRWAQRPRVAVRARFRHVVEPAPDRCERPRSRGGRHRHRGCRMCAAGRLVARRVLRAAGERRVCNRAGAGGPLDGLAGRRPVRAAAVARDGGAGRLRPWFPLRLAETQGASEADRCRQPAAVHAAGGGGRGDRRRGRRQGGTRPHPHRRGRGHVVRGRFRRPVADGTAAAGDRSLPAGGARRAGRFGRRCREDRRGLRQEGAGADAGARRRDWQLHEQYARQPPHQDVRPDGRGPGSRRGRLLQRVGPGVGRRHAPRAGLRCRDLRRRRAQHGPHGLRGSIAGRLALRPADLSARWSQ